MAGMAERVVGGRGERPDDGGRRLGTERWDVQQRAVRGCLTRSASSAGSDSSMRLATISATGMPSSRLAMWASTPSEAASAQCASSTSTASGRWAARFAVSQ